jgi:DNA polymerase-3 subunit alpha
MPINEIKPNLDGAEVIVGGIITNVRSLVTKSGSKMAFVKIEDKMTEIEVIVFPKTYEEVGAKLVQDAVVKITGRVNASDRDGNKTDEAKINAESVDIITDEELENYQSTGAKLKAPTKGVSKKPRGKVAASNVNGEHGGRSGSASQPKVHFRTTESDVDAKPLKPKKIFIRVMDPSNKDALISLKQSCSVYPGLSEVILVIGEDKKAMRMPFRCEPEDALINELVEVFGKEGVVVK